MKITLVAVTTSDGFIASNDGNGSFSSKADKQHLRKFLHSDEVDGFIMGQKTAQEFAEKLSYKPSFVFTHDKSKQDTDRLFYCRDIVEFKAKSALCNHLALLGGAEIYEHFLELGIVDELLITVEENITFGSGVPLKLSLDSFCLVRSEYLAPHHEAFGI